MLFHDVSSTVEVVAATRSRKAKTKALAECLQRCGDDAELGIVTNWLAGTIPQGRLGVGWASLMRSGEPTTGIAPQPTLTVDDLHKTFDALASASGNGSNSLRARLLANLVSRATVSEAALLVGLISGETRSGALAGVVLEAVAMAFLVSGDAVRRAHLLSGDLAVAAVAARRGTLADIVLEVGRAISPMLASTAADLGTAMAGQGEVSVEWKLDGARIQVHRDGENVWIYTRNLNDITDRLPSVVQIVRVLSCSRVVLDGEVLAVASDGRPHAFQDTISTFASDSTADGRPAENRPAENRPAENRPAENRPDRPQDRGVRAVLSPYFFDIMHLDGVDLLDEPLRLRLQTLASLVGDLRIPGQLTSSVSEAEIVQSAAIARGHEGIMVKGADSVYEAGRRGSTWRKVKPVRTFDLVVLAAEWGHGRRDGWLSNLHLGARNPSPENYNDNFVMVGKTFKGLTDKLLAWQTDRFLELSVRTSAGTVWLRPEIVVEIAIDGVQYSTRYPGGVALRFARVKRYRPDKAPSDADSLQSLQGLLPHR